MKLIRLEFKKINMSPYLGTASGLFALSLFVALLFSFLPESERGSQDILFSSSWHFLILLVSCVTLFSFTMLGAVLSSKIILDDFLGKRKLLLFSYPVGRRQLFAAKTAVIFLFTAGGAFACNMLAVLLCILPVSLLNGLPGIFRPHVLGYLLLCSFSIALLASCICLIAIWFGFWKKSSTAVIVSALILTVPMTNMASANLYGGLSLVISTLLMGILFLFVYRKLSEKVIAMEAL